MLCEHRCLTLETAETVHVHLLLQVQPLQHFSLAETVCSTHSVKLVKPVKHRTAGNLKACVCAHNKGNGLVTTSCQFLFIHCLNHGDLTQCGPLHFEASVLALVFDARMVCYILS